MPLRREARSFDPGLEVTASCAEPNASSGVGAVGVSTLFPLEAQLADRLVKAYRQ